MQASILNTHKGYILVVYLGDGSAPSWKPIANFGWMQGAAKEVRDLINDGRVAYDRVCGMIRNYNPATRYARPRYIGTRIDFPHRAKYDGEP